MQLKREVAIREPKRSWQPILIVFLASWGIVAPWAACHFSRAEQIAKTEYGPRSTSASIAPPDTFVQISDDSIYKHLMVRSLTNSEVLFHSIVQGKVTRSGDYLYWWDADGNYYQLFLP